METQHGPADHPIILFDGVCHLCQSSVKFIIRRDPEAVFRLVSLQSEAGKNLLDNYGMEIVGDPDSVILIHRGKVWQRSTAALKIARRLSGGWPLLYVFILVPRFLRDFIYDWIAANRYRWFGRDDSCMLPDPGMKERFL